MPNVEDENYISFNAEQNPVDVGLVPIEQLPNLERKIPGLWSKLASFGLLGEGSNRLV
jgi:hypothetical protein